MPSLYTARSTDPVISDLHIYNLPIDTDPANANSVDQPFKHNVDTEHFLFKVLSTTRPTVSITVPSPWTIKVSAIPYLFVYNSVKWIYVANIPEKILDSSYLEAGGSWVANTWYYIYIKSTDGTPTWVLSVIPPDSNLLYKSGGDTIRCRYIGSFYVNTVPVIVPFKMVNYEYFYFFAQTANGTVDSVTPSATLSPLTIPPSAKVVKYNFKFEFNPGVGTGLYMTLITTGLGTRILLPITISGQVTQFETEVALGVSTELNIHADVGTTIGTSSITPTWIGYKE